MQVFFCLKSRYEDVTVSLVENFHPDESFSWLNCFHKSKVEAPDHDDAKDDCKWSHDNPVLHIFNAENCGVNAVFYPVIVFVDSTSGCGLVGICIPVVLF